jgi:NADH-quinone oxidoreductase subunit N
LAVVIATALAVSFSEGYLREKRISHGEFYPLILWSSVGAMMMCTTTNLLMIFLGLEILSVALYVMAGLSRDEEKSEESALKYFLLGAFASGFLLYGIAFIYGATGYLSLDKMATALASNSADTKMLARFGVALCMIGFAFKTSLVPFHQWTPDVYQGSPINVTSFMATGAKIAAFAAMWRFLGATTVAAGLTVPVIAFLSALTMTIGNIMALRQDDVKRILGYSSIANAGYLMVAMAAHIKSPFNHDDTLIWYVLSYTFMTAGAFAVLSLATRGGLEGTKIDDLRGLYKRTPFLAVALLIFMGSMIGLPFTGGFHGKFLIFKDAQETGLTWLAIFLAVNSLASLGYYLAIARAAFSDEEESKTEKFAPLNWGVVGTTFVCLCGVVGGFIFLQPILTFLGSVR